ncbi:AAA family ATPase [Streptococcus plurextorum]|uniref:AAA family ATPase n=1 Tax=Streptococcus plurextorum TaxID=456876 RepID=UPI00040C8937|nr:AAA family ATPase [Streptococcus plurextorum]
MPIERIMIIGSPGSGKSSLAKRLADKTGLPLVHLDRLNWLNDKETVTEDVFLEHLTAEIAKRSWIIDGNYGTSMAKRLARADMVIWLQVPRVICLYRIVKRYVKSLFVKNGAGNPKRLDWDFIRFVWHFPESQSQTEALLADFPSLRLVILSRRFDLDQLLKAIEKECYENY